MKTVKILGNFGDNVVISKRYPSGRIAIWVATVDGENFIYEYQLQ